jgi:phosphate transport system substrate-binding protein
VDYRSVGSADGIRQVQSKQITFGASDMPLGARDLEADGLVQFPTVVAGVVAVVNIDGIKSGDLTLDGPTLAKIFLGEIRRWNDAAIRKLNPNAKLPSHAILVVRRSDGSGTTFAFTDYLAKVSADWKTKIGFTVAVEWPTGIGANGNEGVAASVARTRGAIGYVEYAYATQHRLTYAKLINKDGQAVAPTTAAFAAAAANADWEAAPGFGVILTNQGGAATWPIAAATFVLMHKAADRSRRHRRRVEIFHLGVRQGRQDGRGARLRADAGQGGRRRAEPVGLADQGPRRQAGLRHLAVNVRGGTSDRHGSGPPSLTG